MLGVSTARNERGVAIIEMIFAVITIMALFFAAMDFTRFLRLRDNLAWITREIATTSFRDCVELSISEPCLTASINNVQAWTAVELPGVTMFVSHYVFDPIPPGGIARQSICSNGTANPCGDDGVLPNRTHYDMPAAQNRLLASAMQHEKIVVAEAFVTFTPFVQSFMGWFSSAERTLYEVAIL